MKILVADDEKKLRETMYDYLTHNGVTVVLAKNGKEAVDIAYSQSFDLIILDVMMPVMNGIKACEEIRQNQDVPVIFLTALGEERDFMRGYNVGADDYIVKPFPLAVLLSKCKTMVARYKGVSKQNKLTAAGITLNFSNCKLEIEGNEIDISNKDFELLAYLMKNKGIVCEREQILTKIWGYDFEGDTRVVDTHIKRLRKLLGDKSGTIKTKVNVGYLFEE